MIALANQAGDAGNSGDGAKNGPNENWLPFVGNYRTFLNSPSIDYAGLFGGGTL